MEKQNHRKYFFGSFCMSIIIFCFAFPTFAWESETESLKNLTFSVRILSIPEAFSLDQMSFSYHGSTEKSSNIKESQIVSLKSPIMESPMVDPLEKAYRPQSLSGRIYQISAFLLRYLNVGGSTPGNVGMESGLSKPSQPKDQKISFEFESTPSDISGAILFTMNI